MFIDLFASLFLSTLITIAVKLWFDDSGLSAYPVLTFLVIAVLSYFATSFVHSFFFGS
jgi:hypothetical protein